MGIYDEPPARRLAYDGDGSAVFFHIELTADDAEELNSSGVSLSMSGEETVVVLFPELRDITNYYFNLQVEDGVVTPGDIEYSVDTTNGDDGTWTTEAVVVISSSTSSGSFRDDIQSVSISNVRAVRFSFDISASTTGTLVLHLYGSRAAGESVDRIDFIYSNGNDIPEDLDYGDQPRGSARKWGTVNTYNVNGALYIRNKSQTMLAEDVVISVEGTGQEYVELSKDDVSYSSTISWDTVQPQEILGPIYVRNSPDASATLGLVAPRLRIEVGNWS